MPRETLHVEVSLITGVELVAETSAASTADIDVDLMPNTLSVTLPEGRIQIEPKRALSLDDKDISCELRANVLRLLIKEA